MLRASHLDKGALGYKFFTAEMVAVIGYRNGYVYVTPIFDATRGLKLRQLCDALVEATDCQVVIKKLQDKEMPGVLTHQEGNERDATLEDDYYAETTLQLQKLFISSDGRLNPAAKRFIRKIRTFDPHSGKLEAITDINSVPLTAIETFLARHKDKHASYMPMVRYLRQQKNNKHSYKVVMFVREKEVCALYIAEVLSLTELGLYCGVTSKDEPGITEWMDAYFFRKMFLDGIRTVYLGGSEKEGVAQFIGKLLPSKPSYFVQALLYSPADSLALDVTIRVARETDFNALANIYRDTYNSMDTLGEHWTKDAAHKFIASFYRRQPDLFFVAEYKGELIGAAVAGIQPWWDGNHLVEGELFMDHAFASSGADKKLLRALLLQARDVYQAVAWDTIMPNIEEHPLAVYEKLGFSEVPHWRALSGDTHTMLALLGSDTQSVQTL